MSICKLAPLVDRYLKHAGSALTQLRTLRLEFNRCPSCEHFDTCELRITFLSKINSSIQELSDEWNLAAAL